MASRFPPLLEPYLRLPPETSLILLSGVLGCSTNWLITRYLYTLLAPSPTSPHHEYEHHEEGGNKPQQTSVVLVSFMRDYTFWKDNTKRLGLDLDLALRKASFSFVDGLTGLCMPLPDHGRTQQPSATGSASATATVTIDVASTGRKVLTAPTPDHFRRTLENALEHVQAANPASKTVLVIDQPDALLAVAGEAISGQAMRNSILALREKVHSCIVTVSADEPLISTQGTPLEKEHSTLALSLAHDAQLVISLRMLDTGTAKDVSGVLRVTPGGEDDMSGTVVEDRELLYFIGGDGNVRVFERGQ